MIEEITLDEYHALPKRPPKYGNDTRAEVDGITFDSRAEARRYAELKLLEQAGTITALELQPSFLLQEKFTDAAGKHHRAITYVADFRYLETGRIVVEDTKGFSTDVFRLKKKLFLYKYRGIELRLT